MSVDELGVYMAGRRTGGLCRVAAAAKHFFIVVLSFPVLQLAALPLCADSLGWRGDGSGRYPDAKPPAQWDIDEGKNILWKTKVGKSQSTPVVAGNRVFVAAERDMLVCVDRSSGKILWTKDNGPAAVPPELKVPEKRPQTSPNCGYSSATPASDGKSVYACYGTGVVVSYDLDGKLRWIRYLDLPQATQYGRAASPVLAAGKLLVSLGGLTALEPQTGKTLWHAAEAKPSYGTPAAARIGDVDVALTPQGDCVRVADGKILANKLAALTYATPLVHEGVVYYIDSQAVAMRLPTKAADTIQLEKLWQTDDLEGEWFASPLLHEGVLYGASNEGMFYALDARTGKTLFKKELSVASTSGKAGAEAGNLYPSITLAGKHLLVGNDAGEMLVLVPGREYKETAHNYLDKGSGASPVPDGALLFLRGGEQLYCIGGM